MTEDEHRALASALIPVVLEAGRVELSYFRKDVRIESKSDNSPVTTADQEAEEIITRALSKICPDIPVVGEEAAAAGAIPVIGDRFFLVDPLDGTRDFISGGEDFTVNIALIEKSQPVFGVVYQPPTGRLFISVASNVAHEAKVSADSDAGSLDEISSSPIKPHSAEDIQQSEPSVAISRSHPSPTLEKQLNAQGLTKRVQVGSSLKFCLVARGAAEQPGSWQANDAARTGHANVWAPMSVDHERGLVFLPTSSPAPDFYGGARPGDNRYANSVVALDGATGEVRWHFQTVHHDVWDYDLPAQPSLVTLNQGDGSRDVVVQVAKTGFVFVLDRDTGEPVFPVDEVPVPQDGAPGEVLSPTQPMPQKPPALVPHSVTPEDAWGLTFLDRGACRDLIAQYRNDGLFTPPSEQGTLMFPFSGGGANWGGMAFNPETQLMYVNTSRALHVVKLIPRDDFAAAKEAEPHKEISAQAGTRYGMKRDLLLSPLSLPCNQPPFGVLHAIDLSTGDIAWETTLGTVRDLAPVPITWKLGTPNFGGPLVTAGGLVFIGAAMDDYLRAFDAATGEELWKGRLPGGGQATPMTYDWQGKQYVVISAGGHSRSTTTLNDRVVAFTLP